MGIEKGRSDTPSQKRYEWYGPSRKKRSPSRKSLFFELENGAPSIAPNYNNEKKILGSELRPAPRLQAL